MAAELADVGAVLQGGGVLALAMVVWNELRLIRPVLTSVKETLVAVLEHVRKEP